MLFNSFIFLCAFLPITYVVFWCLKGPRPRYVWLTLTGYVFYGYWNPKFTLLMAFSSLVSFTAGLGFLRWQDPKWRRICLIVPIATDLALLGFFKYANFLMDSTHAMVRAFGSNIALPRLDVILPIGISFYTFHTITYIVDSYRGTIRPTRNFFEFAAYVSLFSQLVAGPIVRFRELERDLEAIGTSDRTRWLRRGVAFFIIGLAEKVVVADSIASVVDASLANYASLSSSAAWLAMIGYSLQLYFDFSGYSDMAVGLGFLFGFRIPQNFNSPYKALNPSDFWRRWHISLSSCLRDYLYIPFGGSRGAEWTTYRNLLLTMLIGGLWHGANWTFVAWGAYHGLLLCAYRRWGSWWDRLPQGLQRAAMFGLVVIGWVLFRSTTFSMAWTLLTAMLTPTAGVMIANVFAFAFGAALAAAWAMLGPNAFDLQRDWRLRPTHAYALAAAFGICAALMAGNRSSPFLYFQF
jgi:alginate O-acetyltransferase complex protein AlgI